ncbi:hypothetical protein B0H12DRAFT_1076631 [Mycena haematopus]|nr:hypothetical protein B0H12DRAFT_1076631 [Mycena haematopus]
MTKLQARPPPRGFYTLTHKNGKPYSRHHFRNIPRPTRQQLSPYWSCSHPALLALSVEGPSPSVTEIGTRIAVMDGEHKGRGGSSRAGRGSRKRAIVEYAQLLRVKGEQAMDDPLTPLSTSGWTTSNGPCSTLATDFGCTTGVLGRIIELIDDSTIAVGIPVDCEVVGSTEPSSRLPGLKIFNVAIDHVRREFEPGDLVQINASKDAGRVCVIVGLESYRNLRLVDLGAPGFDHIRALAADVQSTSKSTLGAGHRFEGIQVFVNRTRDKGLVGVVVGDHDSAERVARMGREKKDIASQRWDYGGILLTIGEATTNHRVENVPIEKVLHEFTMLPLSEARYLPPNILFGHAPPKKPPTHRGSFPVVQPAPERPRTPPLTELVPQTLVGENDGQWLSLPDLAMKRVDVKLVGILGLPARLSPTICALEGTFCHLLLTAAVPKDTKTLQVAGAGKTARRFHIDRTCIKPRREGPNGERLWDMETRVVVLGPDVKFNVTRLGEYGLTVPGIPHQWGTSVVAVKFVHGEGGYFDESSLTMAKNEKIMVQDQVFDITSTAQCYLPNVPSNSSLTMKMDLTLAGPMPAISHTPQHYEAKLARFESRRPTYKNEGAGSVYCVVRVNDDDTALFHKTRRADPAKAARALLNALDLKFGHTKRMPARRCEKCDEGQTHIWVCEYRVQRRCYCERYLHLHLFRAGGIRAVCVCPGCAVWHREFMTMPSITGFREADATMKTVLGAMGEGVDRVFFDAPDDDNLKAIYDVICES